MSQLLIENLSILLVEASTTQSKEISAALRETGVSNIEVATSPSRAVLMMEDYMPDLVMSSMYFEHGTATDLVNIIRSHSKLKDIPFMLISSEKKKSVLNPVIQSGIVAKLDKPFSLDELYRGLDATIDYLEPLDDYDLDLDIDNKNILLVDDSQMSLNFMRRVLNNIGTPIIQEALDGLEAIELLKSQDFDLVITDYNMPRMDGNELVNHIRNELEMTFLPVLMVTSDQNEARLGSIEQAGVSALCDKPFDTKNVKHLLHRIMYE